MPTVFLLDLFDESKDARFAGSFRQVWFSNNTTSRPAGMNLGDTVFLHTEMGAHIRAEGWHDWDRPEARGTSFYVEFASTGPGANPGARVPWAHVRDATQAAAYTREAVLCDGECGATPWFNERARSR